MVLQSNGESPMIVEPSRKHLLTVSVEDYFHSGSLNAVVGPKHWTRIESRLEKNLQEVLDLLREHDVLATFFVLGWTAERQPELVRLIRKAGHEIACRGWAKEVTAHTARFKEDLIRAREALEAAGSNRIYGYRHWRWIDRPEELWVLDEIAQLGYSYDSSVNPKFRRFQSDRRWSEAHERKSSSGIPYWEFPVSTINVLGYRIPFSGGNYLRQFPHQMVIREITRWDRTCPSPIVFYFFPWEFDTDQPQIKGVSMLQQIRHYRRLGKTRHVLRKYFQQYRFQPIGDHLKLPWRTAPVDPPKRRPLEVLSEPAEAPADAVPVTVVVPLFNEEATIPYLQGNLLDVRRRLSSHHRVHFALVDDGSSDATWARINERFFALPNFTLLRHEKNAGVAAAILTGIRSAPTEIVASIDCDCSYDPAELASMLPLIQNADMVTASPYHPEGRVANVPRWRLFLSRTLSWMYSKLLGSPLHTYTSCFRVYRKSALEGLQIKHGGFLGVAEMLVRLRLRNGRIVEFPTTLESRLFGESKMKIVRTIWRHLGLLRELTGLRLRGQIPRPPEPALPVPAVPPAPVSAPPTGVHQP